MDLLVDWRLIRAADNCVVWHEKISSSGTGTVSAAVDSTARRRLATEAAARANIEQGLGRLAALDIQ